MDPNLFNVFAINSTTGEVTTRQVFDRESGTETYNLVIEADDRGNPRRTASSTVVIRILDINDNGPRFAFPKYTARVLENTARGATVARVSATDGDTDASNKVIEYSIVGGSGQGVFSVNSSTGIISLVGALDYEHIKSYTLDVNATNFPFTDQTRVDVNVLDTNDNQPTFNSSLYTASVLESAGDNTPLVQVFVVDQDSAEHDISVGFRLENPPPLFKINTNTGLVSTIGRQLDYDKDPIVYNLTVRCFALSNPSAPFNSTATVMISLLPVNDNTPSFGSSGFMLLNIPEEEPPHFLVKLTATDEDRPSQKIMYSLTVDSKYASLFRINATTGELYTNQALDREEIKSQIFLGVVATDVPGDGTSPLSSNFIIIITVTDKNDHGPTFAQSSYSFDINENETVPYFIRKFQTLDLDANPQLPQFSILNASALSHFSINANNGRLELIKSLDRETQSTWVFDVAVFEPDLPDRKGTATVTVTVTDSNDNYPQFVNASSYSTSIQEDDSVNIPIGIQVSATDADIGTNKEIRFGIAGGVGSDHFAIDAITGVMTLAKKVDREQQSFYSINISASDQGTPTLSTYTLANVTILDVNDNRPVMDQSEYFGSVDENSPIGQPVLNAQGMDLVVSASDNDTGSNSMVRYSLLPLTLPFSVDPTSGAITVAGSLDREAHPEPYLLTVRARDIGAGQLFSVASRVNITLNDVDDSPPVFTSATYSGTIIESAPAGTTLVQVSSTDRDVGTNTEVQYLLEAAGNTGMVFEINSTSGVLSRSSMGLIDYETTKSYSLTVRAEDVNNPLLTATAAITITVTDANDNRPVFYPSQYSGDISETNSIGIYILTVFANDTDSPDLANSRVRYTLLPGVGSDYFDLNSVTGELRNARALDFEKTDERSFQLTVQATDQGSALKLETNTTIDVTLLDINDNSPVFQPAVYGETIDESFPSGDSILTVSATDRDSTTNQELVFSMASTNNPNNLFTINATSGVVYLNGSLDFEGLKQYRLTVFVRDQGIPSRSDSTEVVIGVRDVNDNGPIFGRPIYTSTLAEDTVVVHSVLAVSASDRDTGNNSVITYSIIDGNTAGHFQINSSSGEIYLVSSLDYETETSYLLVVQSKDNAVSGARSSTSNVSITVTDVNDLPPVFSSSVYTAEIAANSTPGTLVFDLFSDVTDKDTLPANTQKTFSLLPAGTLGRFRVDASTGKVFTTDNINRDRVYFYNMTVEVSDGVHKDSAQLEVSIDLRPLFEKLSYSRTLREDFAVGGSILTISATEEVSDSSPSDIKYYIRSGNERGLFSLNATSGELSLASSLDYENETTFTLTAQAEDSNRRQSDLATLTVTVTDVNDLYPVFVDVTLPGVTFTSADQDPATYSVSILENTKTNQLLLIVSATDADSGVNAQTTYGIISGNDRGIFSLNSDTGNLLLVKSVDFENNTRHTMNVSATNSKSAVELTTYATVTVHVLDHNDHTPQFTQSAYASSIVEEVDSTLVIQVTATDRDSTTNSEITYSIVGGNPSDLFSIDASGTVYAKRLDREQRSFYQLTLAATDNSVVVSRQATATLNITVEDINDNKPVFGPYQSTFTFPESTPTGFLFETFSATDADLGKNGSVLFQIQSVLPAASTSSFQLNETTGQLELAKKQDYDEVGAAHMFTITVAAVDEGTPQTETTVQITLMLTDVNDNLPVFGRTEYQETVCENEAVGTSILNVTASDIDSGTNAQFTMSLIAGNTAGAFRLDNGWIVLAQSLDRESLDFYNLTLRVQGNSLADSTTTQVIIDVSDVNDNVPVFGQSAYAKTYAENTPVGHILLVVEASEAQADLQQYGAIRYNITGGRDTEYFTIGSESGNISLAKSLDYEKQRTYQFVIEASDGHFDKDVHPGPGQTGAVTCPGQSQSSTATVVITVTSVNDHGPVFTQDVYSGSLLEDVRIQTTLLQVRAYDLDLGDNSTITYSMAGGDYGDFAVGLRNGEVVTTKALDFEARPTYTLNISASDNKDPPLTAYTQVDVTIQDVNDNAPVFDSAGTYAASISELTQIGHFVLQLSATDADSGTNAVVTFSSLFVVPSACSSLFDLDSTSGNLTVAQPLDFESSVKSCLFIVQASDSGAVPLKSALKDVTVTITNGNDHAPVFDPKTATVSMAENAQVGKVIYTVTASDKDVGDTLGFTIDSPEDELFAINNKTRAVFVSNSSFDYDRGEKAYTLTIRVTDDGDPRKSDDMTLNVNVM